jgi:hypothetical protein
LPKIGANDAVVFSTSPSPGIGNVADTPRIQPYSFARLKGHMRQAIRPISIVRDSHWPELLRQGLREAGDVEGLNLAIEWRDAEGKTERFGDLAAELVRLKVDVIVAANPAATFAAKRSTASIPIVMD